MREEGASGAIRLDKWLFHARFFRSRTLAAQAIAAGAVRLNGERATRTARMVQPGDVLTFAQGTRIRVVRMLAPGTRRGPAHEAAALFDDLDAPRPGADPDPPETRDTGQEPG